MKNKLFKTLSIGVSSILLVGCIGSAVVAVNNSEDDNISEVEENLVASGELEVLQDSNVLQSINQGETVYVLSGADGEVQKILMSDSNTEAKELVGELPLTLGVSYQLDGEEIEPENLVGKSGKLTIHFDYTNMRYEEREVNGSVEKIYVPFVALTGLLLDDSTYSNIEVKNGKVLDDGDRSIVFGIVFPGLQEDLGISEDKFEIPDYFEISADVENYAPLMTLSIATNQIFNKIDVTKLDTVDGLKTSVDTLIEAMNQLLDGSSTLYEGLCTLLEKSNALSEGVKKLSSGSATLYSGLVTLNAGIVKIQNGATELSNGLNTLSSKNNDLNNGARQIFDSLLNTANTQLASSGLTLPALTIDNFDTVLSGAIASLDSNLVYQQALNQVTLEVNTGRDGIRAQVAATMPEGTSDEMIDQATDARIQNTIDSTMAGDTIQGRLQSAAAGVQTLANLKASLDSFNSFYQGLQSYTGGVASAASGASTLKKGTDDLKSGSDQLCSGADTLQKGLSELQNSIPALIEGITKLRDGSLELANGLQQFYEEGISKIVGIYNDNVEGLTDRVRNMITVSQNYSSFINNEANREQGVKFIYKTE